MALLRPLKEPYKKALQRPYKGPYKGLMMPYKAFLQPPGPSRFDEALGSLLL